MKWWLSLGVLAVAGAMAGIMAKTWSDARATRDTWISALVVDRASTLASGVLVAEFEATSSEEDSEDLRLLQLVKTLDAADDALPAQVVTLKMARTSSDASALRTRVLNTLDQVDSDYTAVISALRARGAHRPVAQALAPVPSALAQIRADVTARARD